MMSSRRPVVTGVGIISAAGCGVSAMWDALRSGRSGLGPLTLFALPRYGHHQVGQVRVDVDLLAEDARGSRSDKLAWIAAREAIQKSGLPMPATGVRAERTGVLLGSTVAGMLGTEEVVGGLLRENPQSKMAVVNERIKKAVPSERISELTSENHSLSHLLSDSTLAPGLLTQASLIAPANPQSAIRNPKLVGTEEVIGGLLRGQRSSFTPLRYHECASATELCARRLGAPRADGNFLHRLFRRRACHRHRRRVD